MGVVVFVATIPGLTCCRLARGAGLMSTNLNNVAKVRVSEHSVRYPGAHALPPIQHHSKDLPGQVSMSVWTAFQRTSQVLSIPCRRVSHLHQKPFLTATRPHRRILHPRPFMTAMRSCSRPAHQWPGSRASSEPPTSFLAPTSASDSSLLNPSNLPASCQACGLIGLSCQSLLVFVQGDSYQI